MLFEAVAERHLIQPTTIYDYPIELSPLSKTKAGDPSLVERFELYMGGMEIANAYSELNDPEEQNGALNRRWPSGRKAMTRRMRWMTTTSEPSAMACRPRLAKALASTGSPCSFTNSRSIRDVILFPHMRPEKRDAS